MSVEGMRSVRSVQIVRGIFAFSVSFHGMLDLGAERIGTETTSFSVNLLSLKGGKGVHCVVTLLNVLKVAKLLNAGVVPVSATAAEKELIDIGVVAMQLPGAA
ncbi:hypothetical protein FXO38_01558 [Capsicum annuum]|nr:hypothetical protein FXO38_01558 [Capsicum annuum]